MKEEQLELVRLLSRILEPAPQKDVPADVEQIKKKHRAFMEILQNEEEFSRSCQKKPS
jgi:hypothetical protein